MFHMVLFVNVVLTCWPERYIYVNKVSPYIYVNKVSPDENDNFNYHGNKI